MISAQFVKVINDVLSNKTRTLLIVLSILVGLTAIGTILSARTLMAEAVEQTFAPINYVQGSVSASPSFDKNFIRSFAGARLGIKDVDGRSSLSTQALSRSSHKKVSITIFSVPDYDNIRVNKIKSVSGQWPPAGHDILIDDGSLKLLEAKVGDTIQVETPDKILRTLTIKGTTSDLAQPPTSMMGGTYGYVEAKTLEWLGRDSQFNSLLFTVEKENATPEDVQVVLDKVVKRMEDAGYTILSKQVVEEVPINSAIQTLLTIFQAIGVLAIGLSAFLIINTISAMIAQQTGLIGVMKAIGGSQTQILIMYLEVVLFYGLIAILLSIPLSGWLAKLLGEYMASTFNLTVSGSGFQLNSILVQIAIALLVPFFASIIPLVSGLKISVTQAINGASASPASSKTDLIGRLLAGANLWFARKWLARSALLAIRNMFRQKMRLALTLVTLVVAGTVFMTIFNLRTTIFTSIDEMTALNSYDLQVNFSHQYLIERLKQTFSRIEGVQATDTTISGQANRIRPDGNESDLFTVTGIPPRSQVFSIPKTVKGRWLDPEDENAVVVSSALVSDEPDLEVGKEIKLKINDSYYTFKIVGQIVDRSSRVYVPYHYTASILHNQTKSNTLMIKMAPNARLSGEALKNEVQTRLAQEGYQVSSLESITEFRSKMLSTFESILTLLQLMSLLLAIVGGLGLMGTMSINVIERTREIGVLRAIGASNGGVNVVFMIEGLAIGVTSCLISLPVSIPVTTLAASVLGTLMTDAPMSGSFSLSGVLIWVVVVIIISLFANYFPSRNAARLTVREVLAYE